MGRYSTYSSRSTGQLTAEELDVKAALRSYIVSKDRHDWVAVATLWALYVHWWASNRWQWQRDPLFPGHYPKLRKRQFGYAVRRVFPGVDRKRRVVSGQPKYGYRRLTAA
jgi:hypothetical protein